MDRDIARKLLAVEDLPTLPVVMSQLLSAVENERTAAADLTAILEQDLAISSRILRLANSAFYGLRCKVDSLRRAIVIIGFDAVRMLGLATSVFDAFSRRQSFAFNPEAFWMHALGTAKAAQLIAQQVPGVSSPEGCFTAGLFHDIGKYCLALALKEDYARLVHRAQEEDLPLESVEQEALGLTHADVGVWLAEKWRLPEMIADAIHFHHRPGVYNGAHVLEVAAVCLANHFAKETGFGGMGRALSAESAGEAEKRLALSTEQKQSIQTILGGSIEEARRFLGVIAEQ